MAPLFGLGDFPLHSGARSMWKIECDALTYADWEALAFMLIELLPVFSEVEGVPRGGALLAEIMREYADATGPLLIVDDVWATGGSMEAHRAGRDAMGAVVFARRPVAQWVTALFSMPQCAVRSAQSPVAV